MPEAVPTSAQFQMVPLAQLSESPLNPRKEFDDARLAELVESVKTKGVLEPLVVRPVGKGFEVAAGARRFRAAKAAGLKQVPAMVREMTDAELLEVAILENVVRADISPLEEGEAYRQLVRQHGYTVDQLVEKTGKSRTVVFTRMKLAELQGDARKLLAEGKLSPSVAELIARLPTEKAQASALKRLEEKKHWRLEHLGMMTFRDAKEILDEEFRLVLSKATFDTAAADLTDAPPCNDCPKRTGADKEAFKDVKSDTCLDGECWSKKAAAATRLLKAEVKEKGKELVKIGRLTDQYSPKRLAAPVAEKYSRPSEKVDGKHTWKELLGSDVPAVVALDRENKTHNLINKKAALELLQEKDPKKAAAVKKALETPAVDDWKARNEKADRERAMNQLVRGLVLRRGLPMVKKLEDAVSLMLEVTCLDDEWRWANALRLVGLPEKTRVEKLKPAERVLMLAALAADQARWKARELVDARLTKLAKLDVKALRKKAAAAEKGTCFVCGCTEEKACDGGCEWTNDAQTLCSACTGED